MLSDRNYMGGGSRYPRDYRKEGMKCVFILIVITVVIYLIAPPPSSREQALSPSFLYNQLSLSIHGLKNFKLWQIVSYMFVHGAFDFETGRQVGGFFHLLFNMWGLYLFGLPVAQKIGAKKFLIIYFLCGIFGALFHLAINQSSGLVGASAGVMGMALAAAMFFPNTQMMLLFPPIPMKLKTFAMVFLGLEILLSATATQSGIAHLAHIGGALTAYILLKIFFKNDYVWDPFSGLFKFIGGGISGADPAKHGWKKHNFRSPGSNDTEDYYDPDKPVSQKELDRILDKISNSGVNSLTKNEMSKLRSAREQMKKGR